MGLVVWSAVPSVLSASASASAGGASGPVTALVATGALLLSVVGGYWVTRWVLALAARTEASEAAASARPRPARGPDGLPPVHPPPGTDGAPADGPTSETAVAVLRGGTWIGFLERFAVTGLILVGYPAGVAILVAIKGLGRYSELQANTGASERFVVGTLASIVWATGLGVLGLWWIG